MEGHPVFISADASLQDAARKMRDSDCGFLPVGSKDFAEGIITDRDIIVRAVAEGRNPAEERVKDYMTRDVFACLESDTLGAAASVMSENDVSRLVVQDANGKMSGVLTFGRIIRSNDNRDETSEVVELATGKAL